MDIYSIEPSETEGMAKLCVLEKKYHEVPFNKLFEESNILGEKIIELEVMKEKKNLIDNFLDDIKVEETEPMIEQETKEEQE